MTPTAKKLLHILSESGPLNWYEIIAELGDTKAVMDAAEALRESRRVVEVVEGGLVKLTLDKLARLGL